MPAFHNAYTLVNDLRKLDWDLRHRVWKHWKRNVWARYTVQHARRLMAPDELIEGIGGAIMMTPGFVMPMKNKQPKQTKLTDYNFKVEKKDKLKLVQKSLNHYFAKKAAP